MLVDQVTRFTAPLCDAEGLELVHIECVREPAGRILRIYIDKPGGVALDDCARVSRQVSDYLDIGTEDIGPYSLEVSSPGPRRPLGKRSDFERFRGYRVKIATHASIQGRKHFTGVLGGIHGDAVVVDCHEAAVTIPMTTIRRANLVDGDC
jgi:ribosome maturation factor RimP